MNGVNAFGQPFRSPFSSPFNGSSVSSLQQQVISALFGAGQEGFMYDLSNLSTLFQDSAGTTPVTATGQPVGRINDISGRGRNAVQTTLGARPTLQQDAGGKYYLAFDGSDDGLVINGLDTYYDESDPWYVGAGIYFTSTTSANPILLQRSIDVAPNRAGTTLVINVNTGITSVERWYQNTNRAARSTTVSATPTVQGFWFTGFHASNNVLFARNCSSGVPTVQNTDTRPTIGSAVAVPGLTIFGSTGTSGIRLYSMLSTASSALNAANRNLAGQWLASKNGAVFVPE